MKKHFCLLFLLSFLFAQPSSAEDGYRLWLRYDKISDNTLLGTYKTQIGSIFCESKSPIQNTAKEELTNGLSGLLATKITTGSSLQDHSIVIGTPVTSPLIASLHLPQLDKLHKEGFTILTKNIQGKNCIVIAANTDAGVLYGSFHFLQLLQTQQNIRELNISSSPKINIRMLNHWDNMNRTVERGYAGFSIWKWHLLPGYIDQRYKDYARANASIGINGTVVNNVNANVQIFTKDYLVKVAALADVFRPYGIKLYLSAKFSAPIEIGRPQNS